MQEQTENTQQILIEPEHKLPDFTFDQLPEAMRTPLEAMGWRTPMPVQAKAIPYLLDNRDMIVQSRTGSGKTGAFLMPLMMRIDTSRRYPQALVLVPTRELAVQVHKEFMTLSQGGVVSGALLYGGVGYGTQLQALRDGAQVIIGTPGRVLDHIGRRSLNLDRLSILVFDEADEMLSMGFYPDMREIRRYLPRERSSWMFSATMPYKVQMLAREFLNEPEFLSLSAGNVAISAMEHRYYEVPPLEKDLMLMRLIEFEHPESAIIFCNTKVDVEYVATVLRNYGYNVDQLSGDLDQKSRELAMERIRNGETRFLVATDVAARGIDISDLSHVFQYDVPKDPDSYVHRAGRTARAGNTGVGITLIANMSEKSDLKKIARKYGVEFVEMLVPTQEEVRARMSERLIVILEDRVRGLSRLQRERMKRFNEVVAQLAESDDERGLLAMLLDEIYHSTYHQPAPTESAPEPVRVDASRGSGRGDNARSGSARPEPSRTEAPAREARAERPDGDTQPADNYSDEDRPKKRKRKRKKRKNRGEGGQQEQNGQAIAAEAPQAQQRDVTGNAENNENAAAPKADTPKADRETREHRGPRRDQAGTDPQATVSGSGRSEQRPDAAKQDAPRQDAPKQDARKQDAPRQDERKRDDQKRNDSPRRDDRSGNRGRDRRRAEPESGEMLLFDSIEVIEPDPIPVAPPARAAEENARPEKPKGKAQASARPSKTAEVVPEPVATQPASSESASVDAAPATKRRAPAKKAAAEDNQSAVETDAVTSAKPKSRSTKSAAKTAEAGNAEVAAKPARASKTKAAAESKTPAAKPKRRGSGGDA